MKPHTPLPCVILSRPMNLDDPCLIRGDKGYIFPKVLRELVRQGFLSEAIISVPDYIPANIKRILDGWNLEINYADTYFPQDRLLALAVKKGFDPVVVMSSYTYMVDGSALLEAQKRVLRMEADFIRTDVDINQNYYFLLNRKALERVCKKAERAIAPQYFHQCIQEDGDIRVINMDHMETPGSRFLCKLLTSDAPSFNIPRHLLQAFFAEKPYTQWFKSPFINILQDILELDEWSWLDRLFEDIIGTQHLPSLAFHFNFIKQFLSDLPRRGDRFLELGFGDFPVMSGLLTGLFREGLAVDPVDRPGSMPETILDLCDKLGKGIPSVLPVNLNFSDHVKDKVTLHNTFLEEMKLPDDSIDFCLSMSVFEHVKEVDALSQEIYRILKPGGMMIHWVDFSDHRFLVEGNMQYDHLDFLQYSREEWQEMDDCVNLWRVSDFTRSWEEIGFLCTFISKRTVATENLPENLSPCWDQYSEEDLLCTSALIKAVKPISFEVDSYAV